MEDELKEVDLFDLSYNIENLETMSLKNPKEVYYEIYEQARQRAKNMKQEAILAFIEMQNIKNLYMLDINDNDEFKEFANII